MHLDIETDNIEAEVERLEKLGAKRVVKIHSWWVMEAPTGQRFCVVQHQALGIRHRGECLEVGEVLASFFASLLVVIPVFAGMTNWSGVQDSIWPAAPAPPLPAPHP